MGKDFKERRGGFTLIEMLTVLALIGLLSSMLAVAILHVRAIAIRSTCQENLRQIGQTFHRIALDRGGWYPELVQDDGTPWWVSVYEDWHDAEALYRAGPLPEGMESFQCRTAAPIRQFIQETSGTSSGGSTISLTHSGAGWSDGKHTGRLLRLTSGAYEGQKRFISGHKSGDPNTLEFTLPFPQALSSGTKYEILTMPAISYGIHFDVMDSDGKQYHARWSSLSGSEQEKYANPGLAGAGDKEADRFSYTLLKRPSQFILLSEANTENRDKGKWTGGRISMDAISRLSSDDPRYDAPIIGRHKGLANVFFGDLHVEAVEAEFQVDASSDLVELLNGLKNVNLQTWLWTIPDE